MKNLFLLIALLMPVSVCHATQQSPNRYKTVEFATAAVCAASILTTGIAWWAYKKHKPLTDPTIEACLESSEENIKTVREIVKLNDEILNTHNTMIGVGHVYRTKYLPALKAHAAKLLKVDFKKPFQTFESHDATACSCETINNWNTYAKIRKKGPCPKIASAHKEIEVALETYIDSEVAPLVAQQKQKIDARKPLDNKRWWAKTIGIASGVTALASVCSFLGWKSYRSGKQ